MTTEEEASSMPVFARGRQPSGWELLVRVQPGAKKSEFTGVREGRLCIRLAAPAVENKANMALCAFVAEALGLRPSRVRLVSGETGRQKKLFIDTENEPDWAGLA